jgi:ubiquinone/menaquinone biosynthesis C-methylase UbiE
MRGTDIDNDERKHAIAALFGRAAATYDTQGLPFFSVFGRELVERADVRPGMTVLDVGTGRGAVLWPAAEAVGPDGRVIAIDLADEMVRRTANDVRERGLQHVDVRVGDAESPDFPAGSFDRVLSGLVVFFLPDPLRALQSFRELLKPDGRLGMTIFSGVDDDRWTPVDAIVRRYLPTGPSKEDAPKNPAGTPDQLRESLLELGYTDVEQHVERHHMEFTDREHWWSWTWSVGQRAAWERVPAEDLHDVRAEALELIAAFSNNDGTIPMWNEICYTTAARG